MGLLSYPLIEFLLIPKSKFFIQFFIILYFYVSKCYTHLRNFQCIKKPLIPDAEIISPCTVNQLNNTNSETVVVLVI